MLSHITTRSHYSVVLAIMLLGCGTDAPIASNFGLLETSDLDCPESISADAPCERDGMRCDYGGIAPCDSDAEATCDDGMWRISYDGPISECVGGPISCELALQQHPLLQSIATEPHRECRVNADCVLINLPVRCDSGVSLGTCQSAISASAVDDVQERFEELETKLCELTMAPCNATPGCVEVSPTCDEGVCVATPDSGAP